MKVRNIIIIIFFIIIGLLSGLYFYLDNNILSLDIIYDGIKIDDIYVGQLGKNEALKKIESIREEELNGNNLKLYYMDYSEDYNIKDLGFHYEYDEAIKRAYEIGRVGSKIDRLKEIYDVQENGRNIVLNSKINEDNIANIIEEIAGSINKDSINAKISFDGSNFSVSESSLGYSLNKEKLFRDILENMRNVESIDLPVEILEPSVKSEDLKRINGVIGTAMTSFKTSPGGRKENIQISANAFKGRLIMPGETVSYNDTTGPRSRESGYKEANVIVNRELVPGVGGGVCQTSTTLYQALLDADLSIVERHPHSIPPRYVERGTDAAVAFGSLDLKFKNDFDFPVYIDTIANNEMVKFNIYGDKNVKNYQVRIEPSLIEVIDPKVQYKEDKTFKSGSEIQRGRKGYKVDTYKTLIRDGKEVDKKRITKDYYRERDYIYNKGSN